MSSTLSALVRRSVTTLALTASLLAPAVAGAATPSTSAAATPVVRVKSAQLTIEGRRVRFRLACKESACKGAIAVVAKLTAKTTNDKKTKIRHESVVLAQDTYSLASGTAKAVRLKLTAEGRKLLARAATHRAHSEYPEPPARATITVTVERGIAQSKTLKIVRREEISGNFTITPTG